jgi:hypothetical protein
MEPVVSRNERVGGAAEGPPAPRGALARARLVALGDVRVAEGDRMTVCCGRYPSPHSQTMPIYRVYLRTPNTDRSPTGDRRRDFEVSDKTQTDDQEVARFAFNRLRSRADLAGSRCEVALSCDNQQIDYHRFAD